MLDYKALSIKLGGRQSTVITFRADPKKLNHGTKDRITKVQIVTDKGGSDRNFGYVPSLLFTISATSPVKPETIKQIYESIRFLPNSPNLELKDGTAAR
ncbi:MAG TPA: hypothetical protein VL572_12745 [Pyrinomonadaceae bacterium]|nr:hypothetical protein [Pyrinomonadaceae bacterium]